MKLAVVLTAMTERAMSELNLWPWEGTVVDSVEFFIVNLVDSTLATFISTAATTACAACLAAIIIENISSTWPNCHAINVTELVLTCDEVKFTVSQVRVTRMTLVFWNVTKREGGNAR